MGNTKGLRRIVYLSIGILFIGMVIFLLRGPYISNALKKLILPELENMTGCKVIAHRVYLNLFPLFVEAKGLKVFDDGGNRVLTADKVKAYVGLSGIMRRELILRRLVIKEPDISTDRDQLDAVIERVKTYLAREDRKKIKVKVKVIEVRDGNFSVNNIVENAPIAGSGLSGEVLLGEIPKVKAHIKELISNIRGFPEFKSEVNGTLVLKDEGIDINNITLKVYGSEMQAQGFYSSDGKGMLRTSLSLIVNSVKKVFGLKRSGEGKISAKGDIRFGGGEPFVDIKLKGSFFLQTLMEILKVKDRVEGWVDVDGKINGTISKLVGSGDVRLRKGNLYNVDIDDLRCGIFYSNGIMSFRNGNALLYHGRAQAEAWIELPKVKHYSLDIGFTDADSDAAFKLIRWHPGVPEGKVTGELHTSGSGFDPSGWFDYTAPPLHPPLLRGELKGGVSLNKGGHRGVDVLGRVKKIKGTFEMKDKVLSLSNTEVRTERSVMGINGTVDISASVLNLDGRLETVDITDLTLPYFGRLKGSGAFVGTVTGSFDDPLISGTLRTVSASFDDYILENIMGDMSYRKNLLEIKELSTKTKEEYHTIRGNIKFDTAGRLFDLKHPSFKLKASLRGADFERLLSIFYKRLPLKGTVDSDLDITGDGPEPEYSGSATIVDAEAYKFSMDSISTDFSYDYKNLFVKKTVLRKNNSVMTVEGRISRKEDFYFKAFADKVYIRDIGLKNVPEDSVLSISAEGTGTFDNPDININGRLSGGTFKGKSLGSGTVNMIIRNKDLLLNAVLFDEKMRLKGKAYLDDKLPWTAEIDMLSGRYDFLLFGALKDVPEDLLLNIRGHADLSGDRKHFSASALIKQVNMTLFGNSFSNDSDIRLKFDNRNIAFSSFTLRSGNASFNVSGNVEIGREYNIVLEGNSSLAPLKGFSKRIGVLRGDSDFTLTIAGKWDNPQISGSLNITNASFGLKDMHQRVSAVNGYFYFEEDRIVVQRLYGKLGGGDIDVSGLIYLKGFNIKSFYLDAKLNNITTSISKDFTVNFNGDIIYSGTLESQNIAGEVKIGRARYRERVEWKSWLLKAKTKEKPKAEPTRLDKAELNIKIYGSDNITVDNNIARTSLKVDMVLRGTVGYPLLFGRIESRGGKVYFRNNEFRILSASSDFADPDRINPVMEIVAQTIVRGYDIKLSLEGQLEHFNLSLISDPPLEETDILSLLTVGQMGKELKGLEGGIGAGEAAAFLTGRVHDVFEERLRNITGLDRVQVDPYVSKTTGTVGPRVTVSKRMLGDRLFVTYTSSVGSTEEQVIRLEYLLGKNISLVGVRDEKGSVGGDIKFRFEFK
ncbi:MAG: translocation/assembly module TamB domain-containing protein [Nitrospirae bacterium]|nr:translocation/assembly module TamB domain-containing protein [Nitrospirota bacterium]